MADESIQRRVWILLVQARRTAGATTTYMKARSAKNKGMRFEQYLVQRLRESLDVNTHPTSASGAGLDKNDIRIPSLNIEIEAKNAATFNLQADWDQTKAQRHRETSPFSP